MKRLLACLLVLMIAIGSFAFAAESVPAGLKKGDKGDDVVNLQVLLIEHNYLSGGADGDFGGKTEKAVKQVQADAGLEQTGVADEATLEYLSANYTSFEATKDSDLLFYSLTFDSDTNLLTIHVKNTGRQRITGFTFKLYQCNASKGSLGTFYGKRNSKRYEYWTEHSAEREIESGENDEAVMFLMEGWPANFSDGSTATVTYFDKGEYARVILSQFTTEDGKKHRTNQRLYCRFR